MTPFDDTTAPFDGPAAFDGSQRRVATAFGGPRRERKLEPVDRRREVEELLATLELM